MKAIPVPIDWKPNLSIFASEPFLRYVGDDYGWLGGFNAEGEQRCILPYTIIRKAIFRLIRFRVETIPLTDGLSVEEEKEFLTSALEYFQSIKGGVIIPATTNSIFRSFPDGAVAVPYGTYIIRLDQSEETLWSNLKPRCRNKIRNAIKKGAEIREGFEQRSIAYRIIKDTLKRSRLNFISYEKFEQLVNTLNENIKILVVYVQGIAQGCAVIPFSAFSAYFLYGGSIERPLVGSMNFLHWEAIKMFRNLGIERYDFVGARIMPEKGSKQEGLNLFKRQFGGQLIEGYMWKYPLSKWQYLAYEIAIRLDRGGDIVDSERKRLRKRL